VKREEFSWPGTIAAKGSLEAPNVLEEPKAG
jgi:hypothetical protein